MNITWKILKSFADENKLICIRVQGVRRSKSKSPVYLYSLRVGRKYYYFYKYYSDKPHIESVWEYIGNRRPEKK